MTREQLKSHVLAALAEVAPDAELAGLDPSGDLREQFDIDSMDVLNLMVAIHARTGIDVPERDYAKLMTLDAAVEYLTARSTGA
jgi:acyl carrier protein